MDEADFERRLVGPTIKRLVEKYDIQHTGEFYVNSDDELADRVFQAGLEFASEVGVFLIKVPVTALPGHVLRSKTL